MTDSKPSNDDAPLNPKLQPRSDETHTTERTAAPLETTKAKEGPQNEGWPWAWLIALVLSLAVTIFLLI